MNHLGRNSAYAYREDPHVPDFDDSDPVVFMDANCALCSWGARIIDRFDRSGRFRICPVQTRLGRSILVHFELDPDDPDSWVFLEDGVAYTSMDAMIRVGARIGGPGWFMQVARPLPRVLQDRLYGWIASNRYRWFGSADLCATPSPTLRKRIMS